MKKFQYTTIVFDLDESASNLDERLNELGQEGWELVTAASDDMVDNDGDTYTSFIYYTLKREVE